MTLIICINDFSYWIPILKIEYTTINYSAMMHAQYGIAKDIPICIIVRVRKVFVMVCINYNMATRDLPTHTLGRVYSYIRIRQIPSAQIKLLYVNMYVIFYTFTG